MSNGIYNKNIRRTIFGSLGRYISIMAIIALGVGFFAGVKNTKACLMETCNDYVNEYSLYDFRLISTYGFTDEDEKSMNDVEEILYAEGSYTVDFFSEDRKENSIVLRAHSIMDNINKVDIEAGRMPEKPDECLADNHFYSEDDIGSTIKVAAKNDSDTKDSFEYKEYKITGIMKTPYYLMKTERGTTSLGDGSVTAYIYMLEKGFSSEYFTEMFVVCRQQGYIFSDEYEKNTDKAEEPVTAAAEKRGQIRYNEIIDDAKAEIEKGRRELEDGRAEYERERSDALAELADAKRTLDNNKKKLSDGKNELKKTKSELQSKKKQTESGIDEIETAIKAMSADPNTPPETIAGLKGQLQQLEAAQEQIESGLNQIKTKEKTIESNEKQLQQGYEDYYSGKAEAEAGFAEAEAELADAEKELEDAEKKLKDIEKPELYVQTRDDNIGFSSFDSNTDIVNSIAKVFPVFFFLIAALVCSTTMSRMIEEERTQIGAFRALGFTNGRIMWKYMVYSGSSSLVGCIIGYMLGSRLFPLAIWTAYGMMFGFAPLEYYFDLPLALISLVVSLICSMGTTYIACRSQLKQTPAEILRPKAPKAGKRVFLEYIGFIWNHLKFLHKVTIRNILRYKKRMIMMILGIGGCASLVLAGFGINDSVAGIADHQYTEIEKYDMVAAFSDELDTGEQKKFQKDFSREFESIAVLQQSSVNVKGGGSTKSANLMVSGDSRITDAVDFKDTSGTELRYPDEGEVLINNKLADITGAETGDMITIEYDDTKSVELKVCGIYRNYVSNYVYINDETYEALMNKEYEPSEVFITVSDGYDVRKVSESLNEYDGIIGISLNQDIRDRVDDMMVSLNYIVILVIACAGALAFIVLFNLSNINLTEREREIATIEVLGFYPRETGAYVFRENFILVILGIIAGLPAGYFLHKFIMSKIVVDAVSFNEVIEPQSYGFTVIAVLCFTFIVDIIMRRKLKRINMAEALKSVE